MHRFNCLFFPILVAAALLVYTSAARAESDATTERARVHVSAGFAHYEENRFEDAVREMEAAYRLKPLPALQYNIGQCYERLGRSALALEAFRKYVEGMPRAEDRALVERKIKALEERAAREQAGEAPAPSPPPAPDESGKVLLKTVVVYREVPPPPGRGARFAAYGLGAVALLGLASGITFSVLAQQNADEVAQLADPKNPMMFNGAASDKQANGLTEQSLAWVSFGVAALAAAGGVGLYLLGNKIDREAPKLVIAPSLSPMGGGLAVMGRF